ncbi:MAG: hypothetical protein A2086_16905 [Spirochaetes bacterium GWD1_27_9]|nr:MAG: hypothetical protein A2Z98_18175 [Spirochaetes bacterium GWB1_27_13]OHD27023.1 MAG: hypothetical protein A2Y34_18305 [Spirochaetes bacterium GWC1_27_15]OHD29434.1 MAG: hypothetical protein A2086_16905 [Spirochaetes bacterium GWD1_27_9]
MKYFSDMINEQGNEIDFLKKIIHQITLEKIKPNKLIKGALLTGSVARGDARIGPYGIQIDLALVLNKKEDINLNELFGENISPKIPYHSVKIKDKIGLQIEVIEEKDLWSIREKPESVIFAKNEAIILDDKYDILSNWKKSHFIITSEDIKNRSLMHYFRYSYLTGDYRFEKWLYREALIQIEQNFHEASECYCYFLYCINRMFIPRKDWLVYLTYEMENKPERHSEYLDILYTSHLNHDSIIQKNIIIKEIKAWMDNYVKSMNWI